jgi:hypothetical protein
MSFLKVVSAFVVMLNLMSAHAGHFFAAQNASGSGSGSDPSNTLSVSALNNSTTWNGSGKINPGDTVHLLGTISTPLTFPASGLPGQPIIILFEKDAKLSAPTLPAGSKWINIDGRSWITIDGGVNGIIELTDTGTLIANGGTHHYKQAVTGIYGAGVGVKNVSLRNLKICNLYVRETLTDSPAAAVGAYIIGSDVEYSNLFIDSVHAGIGHSYRPLPSSNVSIANCTFTNYNHAIEIGAGVGVDPTLANLTIRKNIFESGDMYESPDGVEVGLHRNAIFMFNESGAGGGVFTGSISNIVIAYNFIRHGANPKSHTAGTGAMFFDAYNARAFQKVRVYNNISTLIAPLSWSGGGGLIAGSGTDVLVANNTAVGWQNGSTWGGGGISAGGTNVVLLNNLVKSSAAITLSSHQLTGGLTPNDSTLANIFSTFTCNNNIYNVQGYGAFYYVVFSDDSSSTWYARLSDSLSAWQNLFGGLLKTQLDPNSTTSPVQLTARYQPLKSDTVALGKGANLTSYGISDDFYGNPRPSFGAWTIGAVEFPADGPRAPTGFRLVQQ